MGRITDARGDEAYEILDALIGEIDPIIKDPKIVGMMRGEGAKNVSRLDFARTIIRRHKETVTRIIALDDGVTPEEEKGLLSALAVPVKLMRILNDPAVHELLFGSAATGGNGAGSSAASTSGEG